MSLHHLTLEEFQNLIPAVQDQWRKENYAVFLALCIKDHARRGRSGE